MKKELVEVLSYNDKQIRTAGTSEQPLFCGKDVAEILGYSDTKKAISQHLDLEAEVVKRPLRSGGQDREMTFINESGLYSLIFGSKLEGAKKFRKWVTTEVLPSIRKTGSYKVKKAVVKRRIGYKTAVNAIPTAVNALVSLGIDPTVAKLLAIEKAEQQAEEDLSIFKKALPAPKKEELRAVLTATEIGNQIIVFDKKGNEKPLSNKAVNLVLEKLGYHIKVGKNWEPTEKAQDFGKGEPYGNKNHAGIQWKWYKEIVNIVREAV